MSNEINWKGRLTLEKNKIFTIDMVPRGDVIEDRTVLVTT